MAQVQRVGVHKTVIFVDDIGFTNVIYHQTKIVDFDCNSIRLNSGGYRTTTTKLRMNQTSNQFKLEFKIFQKKFTWLITFEGITSLFYDHMLLIRKETSHEIE